MASQQTSSRGSRNILTPTRRNSSIELLNRKSNRYTALISAFTYVQDNETCMFLPKIVYFFTKDIRFLCTKKTIWIQHFRSYGQVKAGLRKMAHASITHCASIGRSNWNKIVLINYFWDTYPSKWIWQVISSS
jgi:hypothetical protein